MVFKKYSDEEHETDEETEARILKNRMMMRENIEAFRDRYWDIWEEAGFTFAEGYRAYVEDMRSDDNGEDWR